MRSLLPLSGVELRRHKDPEYPVEDSKFEPYAHQQDIRELFQNSNEFLAVNDSPTGGGKTISWLAPVIECEDHALAVYPTNALIHDQYNQIREELDESFPKRGSDVAVLPITADMLRTRYATKYPDTRTNGERLRALLRTYVYQRGDPVLVLTNPDILVMMRRHIYGRTGNPGSRVRQLNEFETIVVDEFHRAGRKEQNTLLFSLDEMYDLPNFQCALSKIVLLSATPTTRLEHHFEEAMSAPYRRVTSKRETTEERSFNETPTDGWGAVMPPVDLDVRSAATFDTASELLGEDWDDTESFARKAGRTVFILDGIHEVDEVYTHLSNTFDGRTVVRIDGFHRGNLEEKLDDFDILVSNSAVEVGIDFTVDRLVFSAPDRASFVQRLGRLRTKSEPQSARCYASTNVAASLSEIECDGRVSREQLIETLEDAYHDPREFESFDWRYSAAEAYHHIERRARDANSERAEEIREKGWERILRHFGGGDPPLTQSDVKAHADVINNAVERTLQWYRGGSLQALVYDRTPGTSDPIKTYDLFYLLRHGHVEFFSRTGFDEVVPNEHTDDVSHLAPYVTGYCTYDGTIETNDDGYGRSVRLKATSETYGWLRADDGIDDETRKPRELDGIGIDVEPDGADRITSIEHLRDEMREGLDVLCYAVKNHPRRVKNQYNLGKFLFLYPLTVGDEQWCAALGIDALYLHCAVQEAQNAVDLESLGIDL
ncbi:type I-D CRISPR-associated helicase Cas3' [Haloferax chudinovii]|uniref:Type I-D CRISPR-associated helicase Cas3 n=1 Tax=Haloferax chudinovii TaxID=1109010 RepID=A0ABD5XJY0_9EURY